jgi:hypothetical protein
MPVGGRPRLGGGVEVGVATSSGIEIAFEATCMAGVGAYSSGIILYGNGTTRGWPGSPARNSFIHFEAWDQGGGQAGVYVALIDGRDCNLNFASLLVAGAVEEAVGPGSLNGLPARFAYSETDCYARFGSPKPPARAPGRLRD